MMCLVSEFHALIFNTFSVESVNWKPCAERVIKTDEDDETLLQLGIVRPLHQAVDVYHALIVARSLSDALDFVCLALDIENAV